MAELPKMPEDHSDRSSPPPTDPTNILNVGQDIQTTEIPIDVVEALAQAQSDAQLSGHQKFAFEGLVHQLLAQRLGIDAGTKLDEDPFRKHIKDQVSPSILKRFPTGKAESNRELADALGIIIQRDANQASVNEYSAFVVAADVRKSTHLMLHAQPAYRFSHFMEELHNAFTRVILDNSGVFEKFTGDGILAYFPVLGNAEEAGRNALLAASQLHSQFEHVFKNFESIFCSVPADAVRGVGVGIDFGNLAAYCGKETSDTTLPGKITIKDVFTRLR